MIKTDGDLGMKSTVGWIRNFFCGMLIGAGAILPGVSGGVLAVIFGVYRPFMEILGHPRSMLPKYWRLALPMGVGWLAGLLVFAVGLAAVSSLSGALLSWTFVGLIAGTFPALLREAGKEGQGVAAWLSCILSAAAIFCILFYVCHVRMAYVRPGFGWFALCGVFWGLGAVIPGLTASSLMIALGLYDPLLQGMLSFDPVVLLSSIPAALLTVLLLARGVNYLFRRWHAVVFHGIVGIVAASTLMIIPTVYQSAREFTLSIICGAAGFLLAFVLARLDRMVK